MPNNGIDMLTTSRETGKARQEMPIDAAKDLLRTIKHQRRYSVLFTRDRRVTKNSNAVPTTSGHCNVARNLYQRPKGTVCFFTGMNAQFSRVTKFPNIGHTTTGHCNVARNLH